MKVSISGFYDEVSSNLDEQIALVRELGEKYICPRRIDGKNIADYTAEEFAAKIKPRLDAAGIGFSSIGSPIGKVNVNDEEGFNRQLTQLKELVGIAAMMNCKYIRIFSFFIPKGADYSKYRDTVVEKLKKFVECVEGTDVVLLHENEKGIYGDVADRVVEIYDAVNSPKFRLAYDASNFIQVGENPNEAYEKLKDSVVYYHIKDCDKATRVEVPMGLGETDYKKIFDDLEARGYEGFMTLEPHTAKYAVGRKYVYFVPFARFIVPDFYKAFCYIDEKLGNTKTTKVTRKDVCVLQYKNLKKFIEEAGKRA